MAGGEGTPLWGTPQALVRGPWSRFAVVFGLNNFAKGTLKLGSVFLWHDRRHHRVRALRHARPSPPWAPPASSRSPRSCRTRSSSTPRSASRSPVVYPMVAIQVIGDVSAACLGAHGPHARRARAPPAPSSPRAAPRSSPPASAACPPPRLARTWASSAPTRSSNKWVFVTVAAVLCRGWPAASALRAAHGHPRSRSSGGATVGCLWHHHHERRSHVHQETASPRASPRSWRTSGGLGLGIWMASGCPRGRAACPSWVTTVIGSNAIHPPAALMAIILNLILPQAGGLAKRGARRPVFSPDR